ncbi:MAG TPA: hypothetical protein DEA51_02250 [Erysipelotrichaceae bacterium]|nr:hypothetical protein [Erysipelotrichaceae bacterium]
MLYSTKPYQLSEILYQRFIQFIETLDLSNLSLGRHELGDGIFAMVQQYSTKDVEGAMYEAHKKYVDVQLMLSGEERMDVSTLKSLVTTVDYTEVSDAQLFTHQKPDYTWLLYSNDLAIFFPEDAHCPGLTAKSTTQVQKVVFKVPVNLM